MGYETAPADGAFYAFVKVAGDDMDVATRWLEKGHVRQPRGSAFYAPGWIRLSYATSNGESQGSDEADKEGWITLEKNPKCRCNPNNYCENQCDNDLILFFLSCEIRPYPEKNPKT